MNFDKQLMFFLFNLIYHEKKIKQKKNKYNHKSQVYLYTCLHSLQEFLQLLYIR